jgi:hypothetical protein
VACFEFANFPMHDIIRLSICSPSLIGYALDATEWGVVLLAGHSFSPTGETGEHDVPPQRGQDRARTGSGTSQLHAAQRNLAGSWRRWPIQRVNSTMRHTDLY